MCAIASASCRGLSVALVLLVALATALRPASADTGGSVGWAVVTPPGWDFAIAVPAGGELLLAGMDARTDSELELPGVEWIPGEQARMDLHWYDPLAPFAGPLPFQLAAWHVTVALDPLTGDDVRTMNQAVHERLGGDFEMVETGLEQEYAGRKWLRYDMLEYGDEQDTQPLTYIALLHATTAGMAVVYFAFDQTPLDQIEAALQASLAPAASLPQRSASPPAQVEAASGTEPTEASTPVTPSGWPFPVAVPQRGELFTPAPDGTDGTGDATAGEEDNDLEWYDSDDPAGSGRVFHIQAWSLRLVDADKPTSWLAASQAGRAELELVYRIDGVALSRYYGGQRWMRYDVADLEADDPEGHYRHVILMQLHTDGARYVRLTLDQASPAQIDAAVAACLGPAS